MSGVEVGASIPVFMVIGLIFIGGIIEVVDKYKNKKDTSE